VCGTGSPTSALWAAGANGQDAGSFIASWRSIELARVWEDDSGEWRVTYRTGTKRVIDKIVPFPSELHARRAARVLAQSLPPYSTGPAEARANCALSVVAWEAGTLYARVSSCRSSTDDPSGLGRWLECWCDRGLAS
jgi:hypothetical protein